MTTIITSLDDISDRYSVLFCDLWGCLHNGVEAFPAAVAALTRFREQGGRVMLLTNAPRPAPGVKAQLHSLGVTERVYDGITTSGDAAQAELFSGAFGTRVYHLGPERDLNFFTDLAPGLDPKVEIERVDLKDAESIVCTGLFDDTTETADDYRATILRGVSQNLRLLCVNPDIAAHRGDKLIYCAGAIAKAYSDAGGTSHYCGKPWAPIYDLARARIEQVSSQIDSSRILCIGDGIQTDIAGGVGEGMDTLFVTGGLAADEIGDDPEPALLGPYLRKERLTPTYAIGLLR